MCARVHVPRSTRVQQPPPFVAFAATTHISPNDPVTRPACTHPAAPRLFAQADVLAAQVPQLLAARSLREEIKPLQLLVRLLSATAHNSPAAPPSRRSHHPLVPGQCHGRLRSSQTRPRRASGCPWKHQQMQMPPPMPPPLLLSATTAVPNCTNRSCPSAPRCTAPPSRCRAVRRRPPHLCPSLTLQMKQFVLFLFDRRFGWSESNNSGSSPPGASASARPHIDTETDMCGRARARTLHACTHTRTHAHAAHNASCR